MTGYIDLSCRAYFDELTDGGRGRNRLSRFSEALEMKLNGLFDERKDCLSRLACGDAARQVGDMGPVS